MDVNDTIQRLCKIWQIFPSMKIDALLDCQDNAPVVTMTVSEILVDIFKVINQPQIGHDVKKSKLSDDDPYSLPRHFEVKHVNKLGHICNIGFNSSLGSLWWTNTHTEDWGDSAHYGDITLGLIGNRFGKSIYDHKRSETFKTLPWLLALLDDLEKLAQKNN